MPNEDYIQKLEEETDFAAQKVKFLYKQAVDVEPTNFEAHFPDASPEGIDLLKKILVIDPEKRITVEEALEHPFFEDLHFPEDEPSMEKLTKFHFDFELFDLNQEQYKGTQSP